MESLSILPTVHSLNNSTYHQHHPIFNFSNNNSIFSSSSVKTMSESDVGLVEEALMKLPNIKTRSQRLFWPFLPGDNNKETENDSKGLFWPFLNDDNNRQKEGKEDERKRTNRQKEGKEEERKRTGRQRCSIDRPQFCRRRGNNNVRNLT
jgi:hypothetical protein